MKTAFITFIFVFVTLYGFSQNNETREIGDFSKIEVKNGILVQLVKADKPSVKISTNVSLSEIITEVKDGKLTIKSSEKSNTSVEVFYTMITEIEGYGKSEISNSSLIKQDSLKVILEGSADAYLDLDIKHLTTKITEGSILTARGYAVTQDAYATTGASLSLFELESEDVNVKATGSGKAKIFVENSLIAETSSGGYISYKGDPKKVDTKTNLGGKIEKYSE